MPTDTFSITADSNNGTGQMDSTSIWPPATTWTDESGGTELFCSKSKFGTFWLAEITCLRWDTSSIDDAATITSANLIVYVTSTHDTDNMSYVADYYDFGGTPTVAGDFTITASPSIFTAVDITTISVGAILTVPLTDLSGISKTGFTGIRTTLTNVQPAADHENAVTIASLSHATGQEPRLEVTYTLPATGASVAWIRA